MEMLKETYTIALPIVLTAFMGYIVWLLKTRSQTEMRIAEERCFCFEYN